MKRLDAEKIRSAFLFAALIFICLAWRRLLLYGQIPVDGNILAVSYPNWRLFRLIGSDGWPPLWNPYRNMGEPFWADPQTMAAYPFLWMCSIFSNYETFLRVWIVAHTLLSACFMGALVWRRTGGDRAASMAGALIAGFNGFFTAHSNFPNTGASAAWLAPVLFFQEIGSWRGLGFSLAMQWLAGFPPFSIVTCAAVAWFALFRSRAAAPQRILKEAALPRLTGGKGSPTSPSVPAAIWAAGMARSGILTALKGAILAGGLIAFQFFPFVELLGQSERSVVLSVGGAVHYSLPIRQLLKEVFLPQWYYFSPALEGDPSVVAFYVGLIVVGAALLGVLRGPPRERHIVGSLLLFSILLSLGKNLPGYTMIPFLHMFRFPANWLLLTSICFGLMCAVGITCLRVQWVKWIVVAGIAVDLLIFCRYDRVAWAQPGFLNDIPLLARKLGDSGRIYHTRALIERWMSGVLEKKEDYMRMREFLAPSYGTSFGIHEVWSYQTLRTKIAAGFQRSLEKGGEKSPWFKAANIAAVVDIKPGAEDLRVLWSKEKGSPAFLVDENEKIVRIADFRSNRAVVKVKNPTTVVFSQADYPGWTAYVDGRRTGHFLYLDALPAVRIPAGSHEIELRYISMVFWAGLAVTLVALLALLGFALRQKLPAAATP